MVFITLLGWNCNSVAGKSHPELAEPFTRVGSSDENLEMGYEELTNFSLKNWVNFVNEELVNSS